MINRPRGLRLFCLTTFVGVTAWAAETPEWETTQAPNLKLPFAIADEKQLDDDELKEKKEGWFLTGLPQFSSDPVNGFGVGVDGFLYFNGDKQDPFYNYTAYRAKFEFHLFATNKSQKELSLAVDIPYVFDSKWRFRLETAMEDNPNLLYFGRTARTLDDLNYRGQTKSTFDAYEQAQDGIRAGDAGEAAFVTDTLFNTYRKKEAIVNVQMERSLFESKVRLVGGYEIAQINISTFDGTSSDVVDPATGMTKSVPNGLSRLAQDQAAGGLVGNGSNFLTIAQVGVVYDTRDLEPDPSRGAFFELTDEISSPTLGSNYNFNKIFLHAKYFVPVLPAVFNRMIFASRAALEYTEGNAPFFEYQDGWSTEGSIEGLGGMRTLRGYKQSRFLSRWMAYANFEMRYRFTDFDFFGQHFAMMAVPFWDLGRVWDEGSDLGFSGYKMNGGAGLRVAWNQSTVLMFDYGISREDRQLFFNFGHIF